MFSRVEFFIKRFEWWAIKDSCMCCLYPVLNIGAALSVAIGHTAPVTYSHEVLSNLTIV